MRNSTIVAILIVLFLVLGGWYWWSLNGGPAMPGVTGPAAGEPQACTMEAMQCPDGSYVGRTGPACAFAPCPMAPARPLMQGGASSSVQTGTAADDQGIGDASVPQPAQ